jgi:hypothetical protein
MQASFEESPMKGTVGGEMATTNRDLSRAVWRKSAYSGGATNCVEVADNMPAIVAVRDSKNTAGPALTFRHAAWAAFTSQVKSGHYHQDLAAATSGPGQR